MQAPENLFEKSRVESVSEKLSDASKLHPESKVVGIDFGGTQLRAALADNQGHFLKRVARPTEATHGQEHIINNLVTLLETVLAGVDRSQLMGVGVGVPAPFNAKTGIIHRGTGLPGWEDVPLRSILAERFGLPVAMENDANLAALGEYQFGAGKGYRYMAYLTISTGVGAGIIEDGRIVVGAKGIAGETGHFTIDPTGPLCACGNIGCLAMYICGGGIRHFTIKGLQEDVRRESVLRQWCGGDLQQITSKMTGDAAHQNDAYALEILDFIGKCLGIGVISVLHAYNPEIVVIGGGVSQIGAPLFDPARAWVGKHAMASFRESVPIVPAALGDDAGLYGAVALAAQIIS